MPRRLRATLRGKWWSDQWRLLSFCAACGGRLGRAYVPEEKKRRHVCKKCHRITYVNPKVVAGVIPRTRDGRIALLKRNIEPALGFWTFPAGFQELGETVAQAAARESKEEICADVKIGRLVGLYSYPDAAVVTVVYEGRLKRPSTARAGEEAQEVQFFKPADIPWKTLAFRSTVEVLRDWIKLKRR